MKITLALLIIIFLAFSGYHLTFRHFRVPIFTQHFYLTGTEFLFLGLLLGPQFLNILDEETQKGLTPLIALVLGWIGLIFGFQFEFKKLRRVPMELFLMATLEGLLTFLLVFAGAYLVVAHFFVLPKSITMAVAIILAAAAGCSAQTGLAFIFPDSFANGPDTGKLLRLTSSIDGLCPLLIFGLCFFFHPSNISEGPWLGGFGKGILISIGVSFGLLLLFSLFVSHRRLEKELVLVVIGMTMLTSGLSSALKFSPLLVNFLVGIWLVNLSRDKERIYQILTAIEKPTYLLLLVFLGVCVRLDSIVLALIALAYCLYRAFGKILVSFLATRLTPELRKYPRRLGFGLLAQGGLSLAILLEFQQAFASHIATMVTTIAVIAVVYNEILSYYLLKRLLKKR